MSIEIKPKHELDVVIDKDQLHPGTILLNTKGKPVFRPPSYQFLTIEDLIAVIEAMKNFKSQ